MKSLSPAPSETTCELREGISRAREALKSDQAAEGYWWYTLEANESIGAGFIQLMHFLGAVDPEAQTGLAKRILAEQRSDGSWPLFYGGPPDLSVTTECWFALRLAGYPPDSVPLQKARDRILNLGGLSKVRVFSKIHLALFGLVSWSECPAMPVELIGAPLWSGFSIYEFSSWARASIVPLLIVLDKKPVVPLPFNLDELTPPPSPLLTPCRRTKGRWADFFLLLDKVFKKVDKLPWHPGRQKALNACERWVRGHIARTEDIYPAMAYGAMAIKSLGYPVSDPTIQKALSGLKKFRQEYDSDLSSRPPLLTKERGSKGVRSENLLHQQCCISPLWDTPWAMLALLESGVPPDEPCLLQAARTLIDRQITHFRGDWKFKNPRGTAGGWAFEFQNDYFPDVDDTIEVLTVLQKVGLPEREKGESIRLGMAWLLSMQSKNGGWGAFDKDNLKNWVNRIPFSDHGACLDPPTPDVTGRAIELLALFGYTRSDPVVQRSLRFLKKTQGEAGPWRGRWGVNFIYGTWCVLQGLAAIGVPRWAAEISKATGWLKSVQNQDGGWGESCLADSARRWVPLGESIPSQTAWAVMTLISVGEADSPSCQRGIEFLLQAETDDGRWEERHHTGTGFPGHFYIRYHGYCQYFPLLALARYRRVLTGSAA